MRPLLLIESRGGFAAADNLFCRRVAERGHISAFADRVLLPLTPAAACQRDAGRLGADEKHLPPRNVIAVPIERAEQRGDLHAIRNNERTGLRSPGS